MVRTFLKKFTKGDYTIVMGGSEDYKSFSVWENNIILSSYVEKEKAEALFTARVGLIRRVSS